MPQPITADGLTGATRCRRGWFGRLIFQVEVELREPDLTISPSPFVDRMRTVTRWRDATEFDLRGLRYLHDYAFAEAEGRAPPPPPDWGTLPSFLPVRVEKGGNNDLSALSAAARPSAPAPMAPNKPPRPTR